MRSTHIFQLSFVITLLLIQGSNAFVGKIIKRFGGQDKIDDAAQKLRPPPSTDIDYVESAENDKVVKIDLTLAASRKINLQKTGWVVHQGQKIVLQDFELKGGNYVWDYDFSSCKDTYNKKKE